MSASDELKEGKQWKTDEKLSRVSEIRSEVVVDPPEILSRVVNLEAELEKAR